MADIKISNLEETNNLNGFYVPGVAEDGSGNLVSKKFFMDNFQDNINKAVNSIQSGINPFNTTVNYYTGEYVIYGTNVYRFIVDHPAGVWVPSEVEEVSVYGELESILVTNSETVHINISSSDNLLPVLNISATVTYNNVSETKYSDSNGNCSFNIPIGQSYTIHLDDQAYYQSVGDLTYTATVKDKYINIVYQRDIGLDTCTISIKFNLPNGGNINDFNGLSCTLDGETLTNPVSVQINNGVATFSGSNIRKNKSYTTTIPNVSGYSKPYDRTFKAYNDNTLVNFYYRHYINDLCLLYLDSNNEYQEIGLNDLYTDPSDTTTWRGEELGINETNALAIHVCPTSLASINCDYYVKLSDLSAPSTNFYPVVTGSISIPATEVPNTNNATTALTNPIYFDGKKNTVYITSHLQDSTKKTINSKGYPRALSQTFTLNNKTLGGFVGSLAQINYIRSKNNSGNKTLIYNTLQNLGYTPKYDSVPIISSTCASTASFWAFIYNSSGTELITTVTFVNTTVYNQNVIPFFAP